MIIVGWPGIGKSYLRINKSINILDLETSPYKYINYRDDKEYSRKEINPSWLKKYYNDLLFNSDKYDAVLTYNSPDILQILLENKVDFIIILPKTELKDEYLERYKKRNSDPGWIEYMSNTWDEQYSFLESLEQEKIYLSDGDYLEQALIKLNIAS